MRLTRTPLRITLGGGGSDLGPNGLCITAAINLYAYVAYNTNHTDSIIVKYHAQVEHVTHIERVSHPLIRQCLLKARPAPGFELASMCDVQGGTGLGASAAFTVGTLAALIPDIGRYELGSLAAQIDVGWQDQYACALGGVQLLTEDTAKPIDVDLSGLRLYDTGLRHDAYTVLTSTARPPQRVLEVQAASALEALQTGNMEIFAACLDEQWRAKHKAAPSRGHAHIDQLINDLCRKGAWGAKLVGAGQGGMILAYAPDPVDTPLTEIPFEVDHEGVTWLM